MSLSTGLCRELAALARLSLTDEEADLFAGQLEPVLAYLQQLQAVELDDGASLPVGGQSGALRSDEPGAAFDREAAMAGVPETRAGHVVVPKFKQD